MKPSTAFLDRDGVLNRKRPEGSYVRDWSEFEWLPGSREALARLHGVGCRLVVVTNQRGVARGRMSLDAVEEIHRRMRADLSRDGVELAGVYVCPHEEGACDCRKPRPGMLLRARDELGVSLEGAVLFGDSLSDIEAGAAAGCPGVLIVADDRREDLLARAEERGLLVLYTASTLLDAVSRDS